MKLNYKRTFFTGLAFLSICSFWQLYDTIIPLIMKNSFGLKETVTGAVMALDNVLAIFLLPFFGALSDKTQTRFGKRIPYIVAGTILAVICMMLLPVAAYEKNIILFLGTLFVLLLSMGLYRSPSVALMPDLTPNRLRSRANAIINLMGAAGGVYTLIMIKMLVKKEMHPNYTTVFIAVGCIMFFSVTILVLTIKENAFAREAKEMEVLAQDSEKESVADSKKQAEHAPSTAMPAEVKRSLSFLLASIFLWFAAYNAVTTAFSRYAGEVWGLVGGRFTDALLVATVVAIFSYVPIGFLSSYFGRKKTILLGIALMSLSFFMGCFFDTYSIWINGIFALTGFAWASINVNSYPMVVAMGNGEDIGKYTGYYYTFSMAAQILTPIVSGYFLEHVSYRTLFPYAVVFSVLSFLTMLFVKHGDMRPAKKQSVLEHFEEED